ncbi:MAG: hypothetical protein HC801_04735 [Nitrospira sp.]|nr:hypothetical protein [Nitrospira sp.]
MVLGPVPTITRRLETTHHRLLVKAADCRTLSRRVHDSVQGLEQQYRRGQIKFAIDIDPVETGQG